MVSKMFELLGWGMILFPDKFNLRLFEGLWEVYKIEGFL